MIAVTRDIDAIQCELDEALTASQSIHETLRDKDKLIATVSHELRALLGAIGGFSQLLATDLFAADIHQRQEYAAIIDDTVKHLSP